MSEDDFFVIDDEYMWTVVTGFILSFILALGIGANDVANSFGPSIGCGVLNLRQACWIATICETSGAVLLGGKVSETVRKGIIDTSYYENSTELFLAGNVAALSGSCVWLFIATVLRLPVSTSHSIVGATIGYSLVAFGAESVDWQQVVGIIISWFVSPVFSGAISVLLFLVCEYFILKKEDPLEPGLRWLHIFYACTIFINLFSIFYDGPEMLGFHKIPTWGNFIMSCGTGAICGIAVWIWLVPWQRDKAIELVRLDEQEDQYFLEHPEFLEEKEETESTGEGDEGSLQGSDTDTPNADDSVLKKEAEANEGKGISTDIVDADVLSKENEANNYMNLSNGNSNGIVNVAVISNGHINTKDDLSQGYVNKAVTNDEGDVIMTNGIKPEGGACAYLDDGVEEANEVDGDGTEGGEDINEIKGDGEGELVEQGCEWVRVIARDDRPETFHVFSYLLILTACFGSFAHGGNDVANAVGPFVSIWLTATTGEVENEELTPVWILLYGGIGISIGLWLWGRRVIETVGTQLTKMTPSSAFPIDIGSATTVLLASNMGLPISTTHCKVGSIVFVGWYRTRDVNWKLFLGIFSAWVITLPVAAAVSAVFMAIFMLFTPKYSWM